LLFSSFFLVSPAVLLFFTLSWNSFLKVSHFSCS
jgi:hypothetical protein